MDNSSGLIYKKIPEVARAVGAIGKDRKNTQQNYAFRGIDDLYNALHEPMCDAGIFSTAEVISSEREERQTKSGGNMIYTILTVRHTFYAEDGSNVSTVTVGEAMDSGDKSSNKSMSAAFKYALMELFCIPTEEKLDTEYDSPEVAPRYNSAPTAPQRPQQQNTRPPAQVGQTRPIAPQNSSNRQTSPALDGDPVSPINELCRYAGSIGFDNPTPPNIQAALKQSGATFQAVTAGNLALAMTYIKNYIDGPAPDDADPFSDRN